MLSWIKENNVFRLSAQLSEASGDLCLVLLCVIGLFWQHSLASLVEGKYSSSQSGGQTISETRARNRASLISWWNMNGWVKQNINLDLCCSERGRRRREGGWLVITFLQGGVWAIFKYSESVLICMRETVMSKVGSNEAETSAHSSVVTDLKEQLFRSP